ncbi:CPBP family intramembrane glutamic endopeptidase [Streptomyces sp. NPDC002790]|uniref:CPBP family intramembrane glutamic endopeptidase n=1 Tax=Streptomyces sp. NPDC002790 TaxID=3154431 RepID=UPI0033209B15
MQAPFTGRISHASALACAVGVLVLTNLANNRWIPSWILLTAVVSTCVLVLLLLRAGGEWADLGLARDSLGTGVRWALALIGIVAAVYVCAAALPATRHLFEDNRNDGLGLPEVLLKSLMMVPLGTVLLEETAFRGVLYGLIQRMRGPTAAMLGSSLLFGLWHILPSLNLANDKPALTSTFGNSVLGTVLVELGTVLFTAAAGCVLCLLRNRSGSLLAPMGLHWATNALGYVFGYLWSRA